MKSIKLSPNISLESLQQLILKYVKPWESNPSSDSSDLALLKLLHRNEFSYLVTPSKYDGPSVSVSDLLWISRELGAASPSLFGSWLGNMLGYSAFVFFAQEELKKQICPRYKREFSLWSFAMSEASTGSDLNNTCTTAREVDGGFVINGEKNFITNASYADHFVVFARHIDSQDKDLGISAFYVSAVSQGLRRGPIHEKILWKKSNTATVYFKDVRVDGLCLVGEAGRGLRVLGKCLNRSKPMLAASTVGIAQRALDLAVSRLRETERFGEPLISKPAIRQLLARLHTKLEAAWLLTLNSGTVTDSNGGGTKEASMAKWYVGKVACEVLNEVVELFATRGLLCDYEINQLWIEAKGCEILEGPSMLQELIIAKEFLSSRDSIKSEIVESSTHASIAPMDSIAS